ncbi:hypothetical protein ALI44B_00765 [Leifsonia sp. ALI-44-B]|uniref:hypothetical protein n=1 Tax=Leifsonia sp. ALI-44-B TaxID=1933776 RepID=UPI00097C00FF|nr:hypothetical protein [Leifsonia sp. ALI-44-B]ONI65257.1 hypothetical protein ALI44B_00765 [Leifsonia sp. ALI-44-B]
MSIDRETSARAGLQACDNSIRFGSALIVSELREVLGAKLVAYIGNVSHTWSVREWADGDRAPSTEIVQRLRVAYYAAGLLYEREGKATIQSWFQGLNSQLDDNAPARLLRDEPLDIVGPRGVAAARAFPAAG